MGYQCLKGFAAIARDLKKENKAHVKWLFLLWPVVAHASASFPGVLEPKLFFSQGLISVSNNGNGSFASNTLCPGARADYKYPISSTLHAILGGSIKHMGFYTKSSTDTFDAPSPWLWALTAGAEYGGWEDVSFRLTAGLTRRIYIYRENASTLGGDPGNIPEVDLNVRYRLPIPIEEKLFVQAGAGYLFPVGTSVSTAKSGVTLNGNVSWEGIIDALPLSVGLNLERTLQNTKLVKESFWELDLLFGIRFGEELKVNSL